jgi:hypothetical protein
VLRERIERVQQLGIGVALTGVTAVSAAGA